MNPPSGSLELAHGRRIRIRRVAGAGDGAHDIGGTSGKTFKLGDQIMQINVLYYTFIQKPLYAPQTNLRVVWSLVYPVKRGLDIQQIIEQATKQ